MVPPFGEIDCSNYGYYSQRSHGSWYFGTGVLYIIWIKGGHKSTKKKEDEQLWKKGGGHAPNAPSPHWIHHWLLLKFSWTSLIWPLFVRQPWILTAFCWKRWIALFLDALIRHLVSDTDTNFGAQMVKCTCTLPCNLTVRVAYRTSGAAQSSCARMWSSHRVHSKWHEFQNERVCVH